MRDLSGAYDQLVQLGVLSRKKGELKMTYKFLRKSRKIGLAMASNPGALRARFDEFKDDREQQALFIQKHADMLAIMELMGHDAGKREEVVDMAIAVGILREKATGRAFRPPGHYGRGELHWTGTEPPGPDEIRAMEAIEEEHRREDARRGAERPRRRGFLSRFRGR